MIDSGRQVIHASASQPDMSQSPYMENGAVGRKMYKPSNETYNPYVVAGRHDYNPTSLSNIKKIKHIEIMSG